MLEKVAVANACLVKGGSVEVEVIERTPTGPQKFVVCIFSDIFWSGSGAVDFLLRHGFALLTPSGLTNNVTVLTGSDEKVKKEFSATFSRVSCVWFVNESMYEEVLDRLARVEAKLEAVQAECASKLEAVQAECASKLEAVQAECASKLEAVQTACDTATQRSDRLLQQMEELLLASTQVSSDNKRLSAANVRLEAENASLRARVIDLQKSESKRVRAQEGLEHFMRLNAKTEREFAEYRRNHP